MFMIPRECALDTDLAYRLLPITETGASSQAFQGRGLEVMREALDAFEVSGTLVLGHPDGPAVLAGGDGPLLDIVLAQTDALSILVAAPAGSIRVPRGRAYLDLLVTNSEMAGIMDVSAAPADNLCRLSSLGGRSMHELAVAVPDDPSNIELVARVQRVGARVRPVHGSALAGALEALAAAGCGCGRPDAFMGLGGPADAVACAAAALCLGGELQARSPACGGPVLFGDDIISSDEALVVASGVIDAERLSGVRLTGDGAAVQSFVLTARTGRVRRLKRTVTGAALPCSAFALSVA